MAGIATTTFAAARSAANDWLASRLPDRFAAGLPEYDTSARCWRVPVWLSYPRLDPLGPVGELVVDDSTGEVRDHTPTAEMKARALSLYEQHRDEIEAPFRKQETRYSCAPACLRMVLGGFGVEVDEARPHALTDCTPPGTEAFQVVEAACRLGFTASRKHTLTSIEELDRLLGEGLFPSVRFPRVSYR